MTARQRKAREAPLQAARGLPQWIAIYETYNAIFKLTELALLPHKLSLPQLQALGVLQKSGGILTSGEIGRAMVKAGQTITGLVDRLEVQDLVERQFDRRDRRKTWVRLTEKGERKLQEAMPVANRLAEEISSVLADAELEDLEDKIRRLQSVAMERLGETLGRV